MSHWFRLKHALDTSFKSWWCENEEQGQRMERYRKNIENDGLWTGGCGLSAAGPTLSDAYI